jgi:hypothetical protein
MRSVAAVWIRLKVPLPDADGERVRIRLAVLAAVLLVPLVLVAVASSAPTGHSKRQAEVNLLRSTRVLERWRVGLIDPRTKSVKSNTVAVCSGHGRGVNGRHALFTCRVRGERMVVTVRYAAYHRGFALRKLRVQRIA